MAAKKPAKSAKSKAKSTPSKRGGVRPGAGRPSNEVRAAKQELNAQLVAEIAVLSPKVLASLYKLAIGGYKRVTEKLEPAGMVMVDVHAVDVAGVALFAVNGAPLMTKVRAFPDADPDKMVCVSRTVETADGDRAAGAYLLDRGAGKPTQAIELSGDTGIAIPATIEARIELLWGEKAPESGGGPES